MISAEISGFLWIGKAENPAILDMDRPLRPGAMRFGATRRRNGSITLFGGALCHIVVLPGPWRVSFSNWRWLYRQRILLLRGGTDPPHKEVAKRTGEFWRHTTSPCQNGHAPGASARATPTFITSASAVLCHHRQPRLASLLRRRGNESKGHPPANPFRSKVIRLGVGARAGAASITPQSGLTGRGSPS